MRCSSSALFLTSCFLLLHTPGIDPSPKILTKCYRPFGCFHIGGEHLSVWRPFNVIPLPPKTIGVVFGLRTRMNPTKYDYLDFYDLASVRRSHFNPRNPTKFIIHGYLENMYKPWIANMVSELLKHKEVNVICVDWKRGALPPYPLAVANSRLVGSITAYFIKNLRSKLNIIVEDIHIIGHSLGAHTAGYIGERVKDIGRITGLDPAYPLFVNVHPKFRLDPGDAKFVDVIHTDSKTSIIKGGGLGLDQPCGHVDFYPNGGGYQPGCRRDKLVLKISITKSFYQGIRRFIGCNHIRAYEYFTESINTKCPFTSIRCNSWKDYKNGKCSDCGFDGSNCAHLGYRADEWTGNHRSIFNKFYLITSDKKPFCFFQKKITLERNSIGISRIDRSMFGKMKLEISNPLVKTVMKKVVDSSSYENITFMTGSYNSNTIGDIQLMWKHGFRIFDPNSWFEKPEMQVDQMIIDTIHTKRREWFCSSSNRMTSGAVVKFSLCRNR